MVYWVRLVFTTPRIAVHLSGHLDGLRQQMTWGSRSLGNALKSKGISKEFDEWVAIAKGRSKWRQLTHSIPNTPDS